jgi:uncharacterized repeat protein (TIGR01451 family)
MATTLDRGSTLPSETGKNPNLSISKRGPSTAFSGTPISYTLTVTNSGLLTATNLVITDALPIGANYIPGSGGIRVGDTISWTVGSLAPHGATTQATFAVTATQVITNHDYRVSAEGGYFAVGDVSVTTRLATARVYLPLVIRAGG